MTEIKNTTKKALEIIADASRAGYATIYDAYERPSRAKVKICEEIRNRAEATPGYNHDFKIVSACSHFFSTVYSYMENGHRVIIKDTKSNTYKVAEA